MFLQHLARAWRRIKHFGQTRYCVLCESHLRSFQPHGNPLRKQSVCPVCFSRERHRLAWLFLREIFLPCATRCRLLHLAPEPSITVKLRTIADLDYVSGDIRATSGVRLDVHQLPFADSCFDVIYCSHVLNMVADDVSALREIGRVLSQQGVALIQVPISAEQNTLESSACADNQERQRLFGDPDIRRKHGADVVERLQMSGLSVTRLDFTAKLGEAEFDRLGLIHEDFLLCRRSGVGSNWMVMSE